MDSNFIIPPFPVSAGTPPPSPEPESIKTTRDIELSLIAKELDSQLFVTWIIVTLLIILLAVISERWVETALILATASCIASLFMLKGIAEIIQVIVLRNKELAKKNY